MLGDGCDSFISEAWKLLELPATCWLGPWREHQPLAFPSYPFCSHSPHCPLNTQCPLVTPGLWTMLFLLLGLPFFSLSVWLTLPWWSPLSPLRAQPALDPAFIAFTVLVNEGILGWASWSPSSLWTSWRHGPSITHLWFQCPPRVWYLQVPIEFLTNIRSCDKLTMRKRKRGGGTSTLSYKGPCAMSFHWDA